MKYLDRILMVIKSEISSLNRVPFQYVLTIQLELSQDSIRKEPKPVFNIQESRLSRQVFFAITIQARVKPIETN